MTTAAITPTTPNPPNVFQQLAGQDSATPPTASPSSAPASQPAGNIFQRLAEGTDDTPQTPPPDPDAAASHTRQMLVSGLTGMPTNMTDAEKASFERGKAAGAMSVPALASMTLAGHAALSVGAPALVTALTKGAVAMGQWAEEHPIAAKIIFHSIKAAITGTAIGAGAKIAGKVINEAP